MGRGRGRAAGPYAHGSVGRLIAKLVVSLPGTLPSQWAEEDERMITTVLDVIEERKNADG